MTKAPPEIEEESTDSLSVPPWFPPYLEDRARSLHRDASKRNHAAGQIVEGLVTNPRMQSVWEELTRRNRDPGDRQIDGAPKKFKHQVYVPGRLLNELPGADERDQKLAILEFFDLIVNCAIKTLIHPPRRQPGAFDKGRHNNEAAALRSDAESLRRRAAEVAGLVSPEDPHRQQQIMDLLRAVAVLDELALETDWEKYDKKTLMGFVGILGGRAKALFGTCLIKTTATIATVSFGREITDSTVREIFRSLGLERKSGKAQSSKFTKSRSDD